MAMHVQSDADDENPDLNTTINTTPLVDVMLVLLIIFLVTIPVIVKVVPVALPNARNIVTVTKPENIVIAVTADGDVYYNNMPVDQTELKDQLRASLYRGIYAHKIPEVHIRGDKDARFQAIGRVILACQEIGIPKVGFLTEPRNEPS
jgi:biopolymer transport protein ExbD